MRINGRKVKKRGENELEDRLETPALSYISTNLK
jgi:hypothetical protein